MEIASAQGGVVIVGAGIAGLWTALRMAPRPVTVITAGNLGDGSSSWAQGGLAAAIGPDDGPEQHAADTLAAGAGLCEPRVVEILCREGIDALHDLAEVGVPFDRNDDGSFRLGREAAHGRDRIVHVGGDEAGAAIMRTLTDLARQAPSIELRERTVAEELLRNEAGIAGLRVWDVENRKEVLLAASQVVLATGGLGGLFAVTTNPLFSQGHGIALAAEAGATMRDLEFVQFHPTGLDVGRDPAPLATEAIRGAGGHLLDAAGERFMVTLHPDAELAPRDIVARGVAEAIVRTGGAFLDVRGALGASFSERFPTVAEACRQAELDPETDLLPVAPAAHYHMGGIRTDENGQTDVPGLYAVGECASTGVHGANRLASNSLLEAIVFGARLARSLEITKSEVAEVDAQSSDLDHRPADNLQSVRRAMAKRAGLLRSAEGLMTLASTLDGIEPTTAGEDMAVITAKGIAASALARKESRGAHQRTDFLETQKRARHSLARFREGHWSIDFEEVTS